MATPSKAEQHIILARLDKFSRLTDSCFTVPLTNIRFGVDSIIGLIPVIGDAGGLLLSCYILQQAHNAGASFWVKLRMLGNMLIDFIGGLIPIIGDGFDVYYKANTRNTKLLKECWRNQP